MKPILRLLLLACVIPVASHAAESSARQPNIVWIIGENLCLDLGCHGQEGVKTPNLDRLAEEGVNYLNVYCTGPVCATSRSAFMTGMYATTTDTHHMRSHRDDGYRLPAGVRPIMHRLKDAGYRTGNIKTIRGTEVGTGKLDLNFVNEGPLYDTDDWDDLTKGDAPFFATINTPEIEYDIYDRKTWEKPRAPWVGEEYHEKVATPENVTPPPYYPDHPVVREEWARFLNSVSGIDVRVGTILSALKEQGIEGDTIVIFFGDNGRLEARGIHWCWDMGIHVPMIIRWPSNFPKPDGFNPGTTSDRVVSLIDVTATTLTFAGMERPIGMQGRVFVGAHADPERTHAFSARDRIDETVNRIRSVRDKRFHYIRNFMPEVSFLSLNRYKEKCFLVKPLMRELLAAGKLTGAPLQLLAERLPDEELYDTRADPHEIHNLTNSTDPEHQAALQRMRAALDVWMVETGDRGHIPEPPGVVAPFAKEMHDWFGTPAWAQP